MAAFLCGRRAQRASDTLKNQPHLGVCRRCGTTGGLVGLGDAAKAPREAGDQEFAANRQLFLTEQGYRYEIAYAEELGGRDQQTMVREQRRARGSSAGGRATAACGCTTS
jgi:hypothetical protein